MTINHEIFPAILDSIQENMVLHDKDFKVLYCNKEMRNSLFSFFGKNIQPGDDYGAFVVPQSMELFLIACTKALSGETFEFPAISPSVAKGNRLGTFVPRETLRGTSFYGKTLRRRNEFGISKAGEAFCRWLGCNIWFVQINFCNPVRIPTVEGPNSVTPLLQSHMLAVIIGN